jgi:hypothetical protein
MNSSMPERGGPRILFCSPCGPYPKARVKNDPVDFFYYRNTLGQGLFQLRSFQSWYSLHFLAQNLPVPSVVLENPTMRRFQKEVSAGGYQVVAIGFTVITTGRVLQMVTWLKQAHPGIEVILGGYGTAVFKDPDATAELLRAKADAICSGEGVAFMREYLRRRWAVTAGNGVNGGGHLRQDLREMRHCFFRTSIPLFRQLVLLGSLGCTFGCPFCATSSQFDRKRILIASGRELFEVLLAQTRKHPEVRSAIIYDEDFLIDRERVLEFMQLMEQSTELRKHPVLLTIFASVRTIARFSMSELLRCGIGTIFIGVESFQPDVLRRESMTKRDGDVERLFDELHRHGINTLGSLILGWDGQTSAQMRTESRRFVALNPTFYQVVPLHPVPGTPLWKSLRSQNRMRKGYTFGNDSIGEFTFELSDVSREEALRVVSETYRALVSEGGPWPFRFAENLLGGYRFLSRSDNPVYRLRSEVLGKELGRVLSLAIVSGLFFYGRGFARRWWRMMRSSVREFPVLSLFCSLGAVLAFPVLTSMYAAAWLVFWLRPSGDHPECLRVEYAGEGSVGRFELQGKESARTAVAVA